MRYPYGLLFGISLFLNFYAAGQNLQWVDNKAEAMSQALAQGKRVLLLAGRETCGNCNYMRGTVCEMTSPAIRRVIDQGFVPWFCMVDDSTEWYPYASGLGGFTLPLICCIDPATPNAYLDRTTDIQNASTFYSRLLARSPAPRPVGIHQARIDSGRYYLTLTNMTVGRTNVIQRSSDLVHWTNTASIKCGSATTNWSEPLSPGAAAFYRVKCQ